MKVRGKDILLRGRMIRIASPELDSYEPLEDPQAIMAGLGDTGVRIDLFTFMQLMPDLQPKYAYPMEWDNLAVVPVSTYEHWWTEQIDAKTRNMVRRAQKKGVTVREVAFDNALVQGIWEVYNESPVRQGKPNFHYGKDIHTVYKDEATFLHRSIFVGAWLGDALIGFVKLTTDENGTMANLMNNVAMVCHRDKGTTNALISESVKVCAERGIRHLIYQNFTYGNKQNDGLTNFKQANGFKRVELPRYYVPLTSLGRAALVFGLHHRLVDRLPLSITMKLRELRNVWHSRKLPSAERTSS